MYIEKKNSLKIQLLFNFILKLNVKFETLGENDRGSVDSGRSTGKYDGTLNLYPNKFHRRSELRRMNSTIKFALQHFEE
jgi:hypothetical protein